MPTTLASAMALEAFSEVASTGSPAPVSILTVSRSFAGRVGQLEVADRAVGLLHLRARRRRSRTADWPPLAGQDFSSSYFQSPLAAVPRYLPRFWVVPDSSERWNGLDLGARQLGVRVELLDRRVVPLLDLRVEDLGDRRGVQDAGRRRRRRCRTIAIGPPTMGRLTPWPPLQTFLDSATSSGLSAESEPAKAVGALQPLLDAAAGADVLVVDLRVLAGRLVVLDPGVDGVLLRRGAGGEQLALAVALDLAAAAFFGAVAGVVVRAAGGEYQGAGDRDGAESRARSPVLALKLHFRSVPSWSPPVGAARETSGLCGFRGRARSRSVRLKLDRSGEAAHEVNERTVNLGGRPSGTVRDGAGARTPSRPVQGPSRACRAGVRPGTTDSAPWCGSCRPAVALSDSASAWQHPLHQGRLAGVGGGRRRPGTGPPGGVAGPRCMAAGAPRHARITSSEHDQERGRPQRLDHARGPGGRDGEASDAVAACTLGCWRDPWREALAPRRSRATAERGAWRRSGRGRPPPRGGRVGDRRVQRRPERAEKQPKAVDRLTEKIDALREKRGKHKKTAGCAGTRPVPQRRNARRGHLILRKSPEEFLRRRGDHAQGAAGRQGRHQHARPTQSEAGRVRRSWRPRSGGSSKATGRRRPPPSRRSRRIWRRPRDRGAAGEQGELERLRELEDEAARGAAAEMARLRGARRDSGQASKKGSKAIAFATTRSARTTCGAPRVPTRYDCSGLTCRHGSPADRAIPRTSQEQWRQLPRVRSGTCAPET